MGAQSRSSEGARKAKWGSYVDLLIIDISLQGMVRRIEQTEYRHEVISLL